MIQRLQIHYTCVDDQLEEEYKGYEEKLGIRVYERDNNGNYVYDEDGYAKFDKGFYLFRSKDVKNFMNALLGGNNYFILFGLLTIKIGLIKKSNSLCNTIVGL